MGIENNGYKDVKQTIINFGGREQRLSIGDILEQDPSYMLAKWERVYAKAKGTSIGVAIAGAGGVVIGVWTGALPLLAAGLAVSALSGYLVKHHSEGVKSAQLEGSILDQCRPVLHLLAALENRGASTSDLVSLYDRIIRGALSQRLDAGDPEQLKAFFQREVEQSNVLAGLGGDTRARGIANTPAPQQQPIGASTRLDAVDVPALPQDSTAPTDVVEDRWWESKPVVPSEPAVQGETTPNQIDGDRFTWAKDLINFPAVLIWGAQGSGKTSFTAWLLRERLKAGHSAEVWDVHREYGQWQGLPVFGDGMDYDTVNSRMLAFERQVKADYKERASNPKYSPKRHTVVCEEFTNFARRCEHSAPFFEAALSDLRKVKKGVIFVSHGRTLTAVGGSKGFGKTRDNGLLELHLEAVIDPKTGDPMPALKGKLRVPGREAIAVEIAEWMKGDMDFSSVAQAIPTPPITTSVAAPAPVSEETHQAVSQVGLQASEALKKIGLKVTEKIKAAKGEWMPLAALTRDLFNNSDDRTTAKELIDRAITNGTLEIEERENPNKTTTAFVRVSQSLFF